MLNAVTVESKAECFLETSTAFRGKKKAENNVHFMIDYCLHVMTVTVLLSSNVFPARIVDHGNVNLLTCSTINQSGSVKTSQVINISMDF